MPTTNEALSGALHALADGRRRTRSEVLDHVCAKFNMTLEERAKKTASGTGVPESRVDWGIHHLKKAGLVEVGPDKTLSATKDGAEWAASHGEFKLGDLKGIKGYKAWWESVTRGKPTEPETPDEELGRVLREHRARQIDDARDHLMRISPFRFEEIVMDLLEKMGYGRGRVTKKSQDGGIDGILDVDKLGIAKVFMQAKHWSNDVGSKELQAFVGTLAATKSKQGVFISTSGFTPAAREFAKNPGVNMVLVGGDELLELMYEHGVGFAPEKHAAIKSVDEGYFSG